MSPKLGRSCANLAQIQLISAKLAQIWSNPGKSADIARRYRAKFGSNRGDSGRHRADLVEPKPLWTESGSNSAEIANRLGESGPTSVNSGPRLTESWAEIRRIRPLFGPLLAELVTEPPRVGRIRATCVTHRAKFGRTEPRTRRLRPRDRHNPTNYLRDEFTNGGSYIIYPRFTC